MEASERPQLPLGADPEGTVRALEDRLVIERLEVIDAGAARVVRDQKREGREPAETVTRAIEIGARVIESEGTAANVDFVNSQFERHMGSLAQELAKSLADGSEELAEQIATSFGADRSDSVQQQIREMLIKANEHQRTEMVRLFNAEGGANPLSDFKASVTAKVAESAERSERQAEALREQVANLQTELARLTERREGEEALAEAEEAGTRKGRSFEERVHLALERLADSRGDCAHAVGDVQGKGGSKKGDTVVEIGGGEGTALGRIVVEIKDSRLSRPQAWSEMNGAIDARDADYALLVVAGEDAIPSGGVEEMHEYQGNKLIVSVDPDEPDGKALELAYRYASLRVRVGREAAAGVDAAAVRTAASEAREAIARFKSVKSALTSATKQVERAQTGIEDIEQSALERLDRIEAAIEDAEELAG